MAFQIVYTLDGRTESFPLDRDEIIIGRDATADLVIDRRWISRKHARLFREDGSWFISDLGSLNGTRINNMPGTDKALADGDKIYLHRLALSFVDRSVPRVALTNPDEASEPELMQTMVHSAVDFSALASSPPSVGHLQTLLKVMAKASEAIMVSPSLDATFQNVLEIVFEHLTVQRGLIMLWDEATQDLVPWCVKHDSRDGAESEIRFSRTIAEKVYREKVAVLTTDAQSDGRFSDGESVFELGIRSAMAAPLWKGDQVDGLLYVDKMHAGAFDKFDLDLLSAIGNHLAVAIERSRLADSVVEQQVARRRLERYHSPAVVDLITQGRGAQNLMAEELEVTVLFADVVGFTRRCEGMEPLQVASLLNRYFSEMADRVFRHDGTLDKFIGDSLMAVFGAPLPAGDHAHRAALAALDMRDALRVLNEPLDREDRLDFRVGMHSGRVIAGDIGSLQRRDYTVLGATVNLASRLESSVAKPGQIVISQAVQDLLDDSFETGFVGEHQPKGTTRPIRCYELLGGSSANASE